MYYFLRFPIFLNSEYLSRCTLQGFKRPTVIYISRSWLKYCTGERTICAIPYIE